MAKSTNRTKKQAAGRSAASTARVSSASKPRSKSEIYGNIAEETGLSRKQVGEVFEAMRGLVAKDLSKKGPGVFAVPGLAKFKAVHKGAERATTKPNPFKPGEMMQVKAKPARTVVKIRPLKALKDSI